MYKIKGFLVSAFLFIASVSWAQADLKVLGTTPDLYLAHSVVARETWFSIGRLYNLSPKEIAAFNKTTIENTLKIGETLKIPLLNYNFSQDGVREMDEVFVPVYHTVQDKEWMYRISQNHNKVPIEALEKWNSVTNGRLRAGMKLVVGYLKVKTGQSALAARGSKRMTTVTVQPVAKNDPPAEPKKTTPKDVVTVSSTTTETKPPVTTQPKPTLPAMETTPTETYTGYRGGYFKSVFSENGKALVGNAGVFRSTSGWKDGKYYALMNNVPVGTIIKVTFPSTSKTVYAKVLGQLPDMRESTGLAIRISDAAAAELGAELGKFYVDVKY